MFIKKLFKIIIFILNIYYINVYINELYAKEIKNLSDDSIIKIAIIVPLSGKYAYYGKDLLIAANEAMHDYIKINSDISNKIQLIPFDDECDPQKALHIANEIIKDLKFKAVIGHYCNKSTLITSKIYAKKGILHIIPSMTDPKVTEQGIATLFRICGRNDIQAQQISNFISKKCANKKIAILHTENLTSKALAEQVQESLAILKISPTLYQTVELENFNNHFKNINFMQKLKKLNIELIFFPGFYMEIAKLLKIMNFYKTNMTLITVDHILTSGIFKLLPDPKIMSGTIMSFQKINLQDFNPQPKQSIFGYTAMQVILNAINWHVNNNNNNNNNKYKQNDTMLNINGRILANWLHHNKVITILGEKSWDTNGEIINAEFNMYIWDEKGHYWEFN